jgi:DNA-binding transcriptional ArsR family regulator
MKMEVGASLAALAHPTRRAILARLSAGEARVTEIALPFAISLNSVSKHIRVLERGELVTRRKCGKEHLLSVNTGRVRELAEWMSQQAGIWVRALDQLEQVLMEESGDE